MKRLVYGLLGSLLVVIGFWLGATPAKAQFSYLPMLQNGHFPLCRLGINGHTTGYPTRPLRLGWFLDYGATGSARPIENLSYFPMLRLEQTGENSYIYALGENGAAITPNQLRSRVSANKGGYWFIGNEPDRRHFQDDIEPHVYALAYHELYNIIKTQDPTAKIVAGAIVQPTPLRLQYLDMVLASYTATYHQPMPVDVWAFHNFILNELSEEGCDLPGNQDACWGADIPPGIDAIEGMRVDYQENDRVDLFKEQVIRFRQWMADNGYRNTPAFLSEFGVLMPQGWFEPDFPDERVNSFMNQTFDFLMNTTDPNLGYPGDNNRLIQRFAWYSMDDNVDHNGFLFNRNLPAESARTKMGDNFVNYANSIDEIVDFFPVEVKQKSTLPLNGGTTTVTLEATIGNSGNLAIDSLATVNFYDGDPNNGGVLIDSVQLPGLEGCGSQRAVTAQWGGVTPGTYTIYVQVLSDMRVSDTNTANNQLNAQITVSGS